MPTEPQKSEVHQSTADASTSPTAGRDQEMTRRSEPAPPPGDDRPKAPFDPLTDSRIVSDETDDGGPLVIESNDPDLNPPKIPQDPFPTLCKPEIDPPVK